MAFADTMGAICTFLNMPPNSKTTTIESKTNLIRPGKLGYTLTAKSKLLNKRTHAHVVVYRGCRLPETASCCSYSDSAY